MPSSTHKNSGTLAWLECRRGHGWNPKLFYAGAYVCAGVTFILMMNINTFTTIPDLPYYPLSTVIFGDRDHESKNWRSTVILLLWSEHYVRRVLEVLFIHQYTRSITTLEAVGGIVYYSIFGFWVGWSVNTEWYTWLNKGPPLYCVLIGLLLFLAGETLNAYCHWLLMRVRKPPRKRKKCAKPMVAREEYTEAVSLRQIPSRQSSEANPTENNGRFEAEMAALDEDNHDAPVTSHSQRPQSMLFKFLRYPHYIFEFVAWFGYAFLAFTWATWIFALTSGVVMLVRAVLKSRVK